VNRLAGGRVTRFTAREGLSEDLVLSLHLDHEGSLWAGTDHGGVNRLRDGVLTSFGTREGLTHDSMRVVYEDAAGSLWIGTHGGGLNRLAAGTFTSYRAKDGLLSDFVFALEGAAGGGLWIGTYNGGLNQLRDGRMEAYRDSALPPTPFITAIHQGRDGTLWIGTYGGGLKRFREGRFTTLTTRDGLSNDFVYALVEDRERSLWVGTRRGLSRLRTGGIDRYTVAHGLPNDIVWALREGRDGSLWIGTDGGLSRFREGSFTSLTTREGLVDDTVIQVLEDDVGALWLGSSKGLSRVPLGQLAEFAEGKRRAVTPRVYGLGDGMKSLDCSGSTQPAGWKTRDGRLWFPTAKGLVMLDPRRLPAAPPPPRTLIEDVIVDGRAQTAGASPSYGPDSRQFEFHYTGLSLTAAKQLRFRYRLEAVDTGWVDAGDRRVAYYTNLPPGQHRFRVAAANADGLWDEAGASLEFRVRPHFYQATWFYALCATGLGLAAWAGHRYRLRRLLEVERVRMRIASDLHDEIGSGLSQIAILSEVARREVDGVYQPLAEPLARIASASRELVDSMSDIVWAINPRRDQLGHLAHRMRRFASDTLSARGIALRFHAPEDDRGVGAEVRRQVLLIFKEGVNNVARHAGGTEAGIDLRVDGGRLSLRLADNGRGFDPAAAGDGNGLASMRTRARELGGELVVDAAPGRGTILTLTLPLGGRARRRRFFPSLPA
jgi:signal transduction histidine kinase